MFRLSACGGVSLLALAGADRMSTQSAASPPTSSGWRTPAVIIVSGCIIAMLGFGPRSSLGFFLTPMSEMQNWGREVFSFALAVQNLLWGVGQPFAGAIADRYGAPRVLALGAILYAAGLLLMAYSTTPTTLTLSAGVMIGFGLSGCSFTIVVGAFGKLLPEAWRSTAFGFGTAAGSFGQFLFSPLAVALIGPDKQNWVTALMVFAALMLIILPLSIVLATPRKSANTGTTVVPQSYKQALTEAFGHRSYILLVLGFFTCGFQLAFTTVHLPAYLSDRGISAEVGGYTLAAIGLFNIIGSITSGYLGSRVPKRFILSAIYFGRAVSIAAFILFPITPVTTLIFGATQGLLWLSTVPPTSALVAVMFGTRWLAMLFGIVFFSHQVGGFLGVLLGGLAFEYFQSYNPVWWLSVFFGVLSAIINLPIVEKPVDRPLVPAAA
jgi:MFS family permease